MILIINYFYTPSKILRQKYMNRLKPISAIWKIISAIWRKLHVTGYELQVTGYELLFQHRDADPLWFPAPFASGIFPKRGKEKENVLLGKSTEFHRVFSCALCGSLCALALKIQTQRRKDCTQQGMFSYSVIQLFSYSVIQLFSYSKSRIFAQK